jgi:hypothetical protein
MYNDPEAETFTKDSLLTSVNIIRSSGSETLQKNVYRENFAMPQFRTILEPYIMQALSAKL